jgi:pyruvate formate lyase activating enzyme
MNIDLKSMNPEHYKKVLKGNLKYTKNTIEEASKKIHIEITNLLISGDNDTEIEELSQYLASIDKTIPLHISRYFPHNNYNKPATPVKTLKEAYETAKEYLSYVYVGNASIDGTENTYCPECSNLLVERTGYHTKIIGINKEKCSNCGRKVDFVL